jgi:hypothetical protein
MVLLNGFLYTKAGSSYATSYYIRMRNVSKYSFKKVHKWLRKRNGNVRCGLIQLSRQLLDLSCTSVNSFAWRFKHMRKMNR